MEPRAQGQRVGRADASFAGRQQLRKMIDITSLPYSQFIGLSAREMGPHTRICLTPQAQHRNHLGTIHASVLFAVAEATAAQALLESFPEMVDQVVAVLRTATVKYRRPGTGPVHGLATMSRQDVEKFRSRMSHKSGALLDVAASVHENDTELLNGRFTWFITYKTD